MYLMIEVFEMRDPTDKIPLFRMSHSLIFHLLLVQSMDYDQHSSTITQSIDFAAQNPLTALYSSPTRR